MFIKLPFFQDRKLLKLGWIPNKEDERDYGIERLSLKRREGLAANSILPGMSTRLNQWGIPSCVGNAMAHAIMIRETANHLPLVAPSRLFMYFNSRRRHDNPVRLSGTYIRSAMKMLQKLGVPDEEHWPYTISKKVVNRRPGWKAYMMAHSRAGGKYYAINRYGIQRIQDIQAAIDHKHPVVFGTQVSRQFLKSNGPSVVHQPSGDLVGGHAMVITGYRRDLNGDWLFEVLNSWGPDWRQGGTIWLHEDYIRWPRTADLTVVDGWQRLRK